MADLPIEELGNKTPLEAAKTPNMDWIAKKGLLGRVYTVPDGLHPGSDVANMGILGYDPRVYYTGRGPIEAASLNLDVPEEKIVFRCNLVTIRDDVMVDFTAGHISSEEGRELLEELNRAIPFETARFFPGVSYRNLAILDETLLGLTCAPPHDITNQKSEDYLPKEKGSERVIELMKMSEIVFRDSEINQRRVQNGKSPATHIWLWSQGRLPKLPSFQKTFGLSGGIVTAVDLLKGLGRLVQLEIPLVEGATGFIDTNYKGKFDAALRILDRHPFVFIHVEAPDEAGHMGRSDLKVKAIEDFDAHIVGPALEYQARHPETRVLVLPDHPTPCSIRTHSHASVPFAMYYDGLSQNGQANAYSEAEAEKSVTEFSYPWDLMRVYLNKI